MSLRDCKTAYVAAPFTRKDEVRAAHKRLEQLGVEPTSRWVDSHNSDYDSPKSTLTKEALEDLLDVHRAEALVLLNYPEMQKEGSGGKHVEFGFALAKGKHIYIVGEPSCLFHYHPAVTHVKTLEELR